MDNLQNPVVNSYFRGARVIWYYLDGRKRHTFIVLERLVPTSVLPIGVVRVNITCSYLQKLADGSYKVVSHEITLGQAEFISAN